MSSRREYEMLFRLSANTSGKFNSTFGNAQATITQLQNEINALNRTQRDISSYQKQQKAVENTQKKLEMYRQQLANVQKEMAGTGSYSSSLANKEVELQARIERTEGTLSNQNEKLHQMGAALSDAGVDTKNLSQSSEQLGAKINDLKKEEEEAAEQANEFGSSGAQAFEEIKQALVAAGIAVALKEIYEYYLDCADAATDFETAMTGVAKTTDLTDAEFAAMSESVKELSTEIPATTEELAAIAETAGQLGIEKNNLLDFTEIMAMLGTATNMTSEEGATMLAQFAAITNMDPSYYMNLGSTIVALGNNFSTTEQNIANMNQRIAAAGSIAEMSEAEISAISAAVTSLGIRAENGGTQMTKLISDINSAVSSGEDLSAWADAAGMSADDFAAAWGDDAASALDMFIRGLNDTYAAGGDVYSVLSDLGITETRMVTMVTSLAKSGDRLTNTLATANTAWAENTALTKEAEKRYSTTQSELTLLENSYNNLQIAIGENYNPALRELYELGAEILGGMTEFVQKNPALVKAITAATIAVGVFTAGIIAYTVAQKLAIVLTKAFTAVLNMNPVFLAITAVAALTAGIAALCTSVESTIPDVEDLTEATREMAEVAEEAEQTYKDSVVSIDAAADVANRYIDKLEELEAAGITTDAQAKEYHSTLVLLTEVVPELAEYIDLETNAINGGTEALENNVAAWKKRAVEQAYQEKITAIHEKYADVVLEAAENEILFTEAQAAADAAGQKHSDAIDRMNQLMDEATETAAKYSEELGETQNPVNYLTQEYYDLQNSLADLVSEQYEAQQIADGYDQAIKDSEEVLTEYEDEISLAEEAIENLTEAEEEAAAAAEEAAEKQAVITEAIEDTEGKISDLIDAYDNAYNAALQSVGGQYNLWDTAAEVVATNVGDMNASIESQTSYWQNYNGNLASLSERAGDIEGLSDVIASFADGSKDSVNAVAGMASASDEDLATMVANWQELQQEHETTAGSIAELETDFSASMDAILQELNTTVTEMDMSGEASKAATDTVMAYISSIEAQTEGAYLAAQAVAQAAKDGFNSVTGGGVSITVNGEDADHNAAGTMSASRGWSWVGEKGPELMLLGGGEMILPSDISLALSAAESMLRNDPYLGISPQSLMAYPTTLGAGYNAVSANIGDRMNIGDRGGLGGITINPVYNITVGSAADADELRETVSKMHDDLIEKIEDYYADKERRAYI